jgi:hypothetical protein
MCGRNGHDVSFRQYPRFFLEGQWKIAKASVKIINLRLGFHKNLHMRGNERTDTKKYNEINVQSDIC